MAGVQVYAVDNSQSIPADYTIRLSSGNVSGCTQLTGGANSVTRLGLVVPEETVILGVWIKPDSVASGNCNFTLIEAGSFRQLGSGQGGAFLAAAAPTGAVTAATRCTQTVNLRSTAGGGAATADTLLSVPIHPASGGQLNNNVVPPGGEVFAHIAEDPAALGFQGTLIVRVRTKGR